MARISSGAGVALNGGTLITSGTLLDGADGTGNTTRAAGDAVKFGGTATTLNVDSGAVFHGAIGGFAIGDKIDITNLTATQVAADFDATTHTLTAHAAIAAFKG